MSTTVDLVIVAAAQAQLGIDTSPETNAKSAVGIYAPTLSFEQIEGQPFMLISDRERHVLLKASEMILKLSVSTGFLVDGGYAELRAVFEERTWKIDSGALRAAIVSVTAPSFTIDVMGYYIHDVVLPNQQKAAA